MFENPIHKRAEFVGKHDPCAVADSDLVCSGIDRRVDRLIKEIGFRARRIQRGELYVLAVVTAFLHLLPDLLEHGWCFLMADIFHLQRGQRNQQIELRLLCGTYALPCLFDISGRDIHSGGNACGDHGSDGTVRKLVSSAAGDGRQLDRIGFQAVQAPGDFQLFLEGELSAADPAGFPECHVNEFYCPHNDSLLSVMIKQKSRRFLSESPGRINQV